MLSIILCVLAVALVCAVAICIKKHITVLDLEAALSALEQDFEARVALIVSLRLAVQKSQNPTSVPKAGAAGGPAKNIGGKRSKS